MLGALGYHSWCWPGCSSGHPFNGVQVFRYKGIPVGAKYYMLHGLWRPFTLQGLYFQVHGVFAPTAKCREVLQRLCRDTAAGARGWLRSKSTLASCAAGACSFVVFHGSLPWCCKEPELGP